MDNENILMVKTILLFIEPNTTVSSMIIRVALGINSTDYYCCAVVLLLYFSTHYCCGELHLHTAVGSTAAYYTATDSIIFIVFLKTL